MFADLLFNLNLPNANGPFLAQAFRDKRVNGHLRLCQSKGFALPVSPNGGSVGLDAVSIWEMAISLSCSLSQ